MKQMVEDHRTALTSSAGLDIISATEGIAMRPTLILFDLDDTLLRSDKSISAYSAGVLRACQERGILIAFATARGETNIQPFIRQIEPDVVISSGGAMIRWRGKIIEAQTFAPDETAAILAAGIGSQGRECLITVDALDGYYGNYLADADGLLTGWGEVIGADFSTFRKPALKICLHLPDDQVAAQVAGAVPGCDWLRFTGSQWYKFTRANVNKARAAARVSELLGIAPADMIAFGDDRSDLEMLRYCGTGAAVANAIPEVKAAADIIVGSQDEDGPAVYLERSCLSVGP